MLSQSHETICGKKALERLMLQIADHADIRESRSGMEIGPSVMHSIYVHTPECKGQLGDQILLRASASPTPTLPQKLARSTKGYRSDKASISTTHLTVFGILNFDNTYCTGLVIRTVCWQRNII